MARLNVNTIVNRNDSGPPKFPYGVSIPPGSSFAISTNYNFTTTGVTTVGFLSASNVQVGIITATSFVGDGSALTGTPIADYPKAIALKIILDPLPFRA